MQKFISIFILASFSFTSILGQCPIHAQEFYLPVPGVMVPLSPEFNPPILKGLKVNPTDPFRFDFILDKGDSFPLKSDATRLIKYFLAGLTIPENDLWVNLSPYEKNRIIPNSFGQTEMGRDLLAEDYMLKQITASLIYPEDQLGKKFWKRIYEEAAKKFGTTNIPVNTFNKVWIIPDKAVVYENAKIGTAYVVESKLKVMLEQDYLALQKQLPLIPSLTKEGGISSNPPLFYKEGARGSSKSINALGSQITREIVIPELTKEVNEGKNFSQLRQVYNSLILATWYKQKIKNSILEQVYADRQKVAGVGYENSVIKGDAAISETEAIYQRYLQAFKRGAFNYIKEDLDPLTQQSVPRKYFSGGTDLALLGTLKTAKSFDYAQFVKSDLSLVQVRVDSLEQNVKLLNDQDMESQVKETSDAELSERLSLEEEFMFVLARTVKRRLIKNVFDLKSIEEQKVFLNTLWLDKPSEIDESLYKRIWQMFKRSNLIEPVIVDHLSGAHWAFTQSLVDSSEADMQAEISKEYARIVNRSMEANKLPPLSGTEDLAFAIYKAVNAEKLPVEFSFSKVRLNERAIEPYWQDLPGRLEGHDELFNQAAHLLIEAGLAQDINNRGEVFKIISDDIQEQEALTRIRATNREAKEAGRQRMMHGEVSREVSVLMGHIVDLMKQRLAHPGDLAYKIGIRVENGFWQKEDHMREAIWWGFDQMDGFEAIRKRGDIKEMADFYRKNILTYEPIDKSLGKGQMAFLKEKGLKRISVLFHDNISLFLQYAFPGLVDENEPGALRPWEVGRSLEDERLVKKVILEACDHIPGFYKARIQKENNIKAMVDAYRKFFFENEPKSQLEFFQSFAGFEGLFTANYPFLETGKSVAKFLRFALPGLISENNADALRPWEIEGIWNDQRLAKKAIIQTLDKIPDFKEARIHHNVEAMAQAYRKHLLGKDRVYPLGQLDYFYKIGGLKGLMLHKRMFLDKSCSPGALLRFALPELLGSNGLKFEEMERDQGQLSADQEMESQVKGNGRFDLSEHLSVETEFLFVFVKGIEQGMDNVFDWETIEKNKAKLSKFWLDWPSEIDESLYKRTWQLFKRSGIFEPVIVDGTSEAKWRINPDLRSFSDKDLVDYLSDDYDRMVKKEMDANKLKPISEEEDFAHALYRAARNRVFAKPGQTTEEQELTWSGVRLNEREIEPYWQDFPGTLEKNEYLFNEAVELLREAGLARDISGIGKVYKLTQEEIYDEDVLARIENVKRQELEVGRQRMMYAEISEAVDNQMVKIINAEETKPQKIAGSSQNRWTIRVSNGFWQENDNMREAIWYVFDLMPGFREVRKTGDIKAIADFFRKHIFTYSARNPEYGTGVAAYIKDKGLSRLLGNFHGSIANLIRYAFPGLINEDAEGAIRPWEMEEVWKDQRLVKKAIIQALDKIPGFQEARIHNDLKGMAKVYRDYFLVPNSTYQLGQQRFFYNECGLNGLMNNRRNQLVVDKSGSPAAVLRFAIPGLISENAPGALKPWEVEKTWDDARLAKKAIIEALDKIPGFHEARINHNIESMAEAYRRYLLGSNKIYPFSPEEFFNQEGHLATLMTHPKKFLDWVDSPSALLRFAMPELVDQTNDKALRLSEIEFYKTRKPAGDKDNDMESQLKEPGDVELSERLSLEEEFMFVLARAVKRRLIKNVFDLKSIEEQKVFLNTLWLDKPSEIDESLYNRIWQKFKRSNLVEPVIVDHVSGAHWAFTQNLLDLSEAGIQAEISKEYARIVNRSMEANKLPPLSGTEDLAFAIYKAVKAEKLPVEFSFSKVRLNERAIEPYWQDLPGRLEGHDELFNQAAHLLIEAGLAQDINNRGEVFKIISDDIQEQEALTRIRATNREAKEAGRQRMMHGEVSREVSVLMRKIVVRMKLRLAHPGVAKYRKRISVRRGFWQENDHLREAIWWGFDQMNGFDAIRKSGVIQDMADFYRKNILTYEPKDKNLWNGQAAFFKEKAILRILDYFHGNILLLLPYAFPGLVDENAEGALRPWEVGSTLEDERLAKKVILEACDHIPGFYNARTQKENNIKAMADAYRKFFFGEESRAQVKFFKSFAGLRGLLTAPHDYLDKSGSVAALLRFALPGLINENDPDALHPWEIEESWSDQRLAKKAIIQALDKIPDFQEVRIHHDVEGMAQAYRKHLLGKDSVYPAGQNEYFSKIGKLSGLMTHNKFLDKIGSAAALLRFALPEIFGPNGLKYEEIERDLGQVLTNQDKGQSESDRMMKGKNEGGIDLTAGKMSVEVKDGIDSPGIKFHLDAAMLARLQNSPGFVPVIINIQPMMDLKVFLDSR